MVRDELDLSDYRPSRVPRVLMIASAVAVALVAAWFFAPILITGYAKAIAAIGPRTARVEQPPVSAALAAAPAAPAENVALAPVTTATATRNDDNASTLTAPRAAENNAAAPWPADMPAWPHPQDQAASAAPAAPPPVQPAVSAPSTLAATAEPIQLASAAPPDPNADAAPNPDAAANPDLPANVPLPRSRPSRLIAARVAIPLPRPRPDIDNSDAPTPEMRAFELQVERMR